MGSAGYGIKVRLLSTFAGRPWQRFKYKGRKKMKNVMPMQPYLVLDTDDYEVKKK